MKRIALLAFVSLALGACATAEEANKTNVYTPPDEPEHAADPALEVNDLRSYECYSSVCVGGSITNISDESVGELYPILDTYTKDGTYIEEVWGSLEFRTLLPGQTATFEFSMYGINPLTHHGVVKFNVPFSEASEYSGEGSVLIALPSE